MQIKSFGKMARNNGPLVVHGNTAQENRRILHELKNRSQIETPTKDELRRLFSKLNQSCKARLAKDESHQNSPWHGKNPATCTYGPVPGFPPGSWWGIRMDCSRDRVHDPFDEDLQVGPYGVVSVCTSSGTVNEDADFGEFLTLTGQKYTGIETDGDPLLQNYENRVPVRLVRSYNLLNEFAPKTGYRYDGLYCVVDRWIGVNSDSGKCYKFALARVSDQEPSPWDANTSGLVAKNTFSTVYSESQAIENCSKCVSSFGRYEFRKYSHGSSPLYKRAKQEKTTGDSAKVFEVENPGPVAKQKSAPESAIVTRHVFKKTNPIVESASQPSTSTVMDNKSLSNIGTQASKTHSTNISIRMGLYDSSHSVQDVKKAASVSFCRVAKPITILKTGVHMENYNLANRDNKAKTDPKVDTPRAQGKSTTDISVQNSPGVVVPPSTRTRQVGCPGGSAKMAESEETGRLVPGNDSDKIEVQNELPKVNAEKPEEPVEETDPGETRDQSLLGLGESSYMQGLKSLGPLDSLTPDKILNLIDKEKYHPLSALLMGDMIGLTTEQSAALRIQAQRSMVNKKEDVEKKNFKATSDDIIGSRCYKFRRRRRLAKKILNKPEIPKGEQVSKQDTQDRKSGVRGTGNGYQNGYEAGTTKKFARPGGKRRVVEAKNEIRTRLRTLRSIRPAVKKRVHKKQMREIANLSIDAKIGPKIRGPRNRRLRCINPIYTKRSYERFSTVITALTSGERTFDKGERLAKVEQPRLGTTEGLALKRKGGRSRNMEVAEQKYKKRKETVIAEENGSRKGNREMKSVQTGGDRKGRRSKFAQTVNGEPWKETSGRITGKPCTVDAVTQCTLISEEKGGSRSRRRVEEEERGRKSGGYEGTGSVDENQDHQGLDWSSRMVGHSCARELEYTRSEAGDDGDLEEEQHLSAFVPVKTLDNDLRIARLRSIGFRPIATSPPPAPPLKGEQQEVEVVVEEEEEEELDNQSAICSSEAKQEEEGDPVDGYNEYSNDESNIVLYLGEELQYQSIEDEDKGSSVLRRSSSSSSNAKVSAESSSPPFTKGNTNMALDQEAEPPWHGWKRVVTSEDSYWIGW